MWSASPAPSGPTSSPSLAAATAGATVDTRTTTGRAYSYGVAMSTTRYIGRANIAKRLSALDGSAGRAVYRDGSATFELDEAALSVTPPFGLEHVGEYDVVRAGPLLDALEIEPRVAVLLVRMGGYAVGVFDGAAAEAARVLGPWRDSVAHVALGGDRSAVSRVLESRADLAWLQPLALERFFDVPEPRLRVLEELPYQLYAAKVVEEAR